MIKEYGLYYTYSKDKDTLEILFSDGDFTSTKSYEDIDIFYNKNDIVKINIYGIKKYVKIRINGLIYLPSSEFLSLINGYIGKFGLMLADKNNSGFFIDKKDDYFIIKAKKGTFFPDKTCLKEDKICTYKDLSISESNSILRIEEGLFDKDIGKDFFAMEEHENVGNWIKKSW